MNEVIYEQCLDTGQLIQLVHGDITKETTGAIVNAANAHLQHGGGVAGIISRRGGPQIQEESNNWVKQHGPVQHAEPAFTGAGDLSCSYVIHAVGPIWGEGDEDHKLAQAIGGSLCLADKLNLESIAIPAISTGIYGFPKSRAAGVILPAIKEYFDQNPGSQLSLVRLVLFDEPTLQAFMELWDTSNKI
jgi:O-acetyl-ADP-ribose deacetylase (regulator of RNase III)